MTDASSSLGASAAEAADPLAADPAAGTDAVGDASRRATAPFIAAPADRPAKPFWARLDSPFTVGLPAHASAASRPLLLGRRAHQHLDGDHLHRPRDVRRAGPRSRHQVARAAQRQARVGDHHRLPRLRRRPRSASSCSSSRRWSTQIGAFITGIPDTIDNFEKSDFFHWLEGIFGDRPRHARRPTSRSGSPTPRTSRRSRGGAAEGRRRHRDGDLGRPHRHRADPVLHRLAARHQGVAHAVRAGAQPARRCGR